MLISTKGRYALRVLADLAEHQSEKLIPMKEIAERQNISAKYMERIMTVLSKNGIVEGTHGKGGGYRLALAPDQCVIGDILRLTEGTLAPVTCLADNDFVCERIDECRTIGMWRELENRIVSYLDGVTLADLMQDRQ